MDPLPLAPYRSAIAELCRRHGVASLALFGSAARGEFKPGASDYDFLIELDPAAPGSRAARLVDFAEGLEALLGAHVDLVNPRYIRNPYFAAEVARTRVPIYA
ncbi:nucleotidyltransferase family protein [Aquabacterium sp.]|uniref:nucleotidyltransferase family protein n=1 Tax=Aquabacterium sp. TaxID=1872578 RepID=UPI002CEDEA1A|nr:nucleotidyltransferase domain-containing protein [Aquabacterium sp.]HSW07185.1 nucleotidyltransferase domain-containing protein [Aquabacterium sp.]